MVRDSYKETSKVRLSDDVQDEAPVEQPIQAQNQSMQVQYQQVPPVQSVNYQQPTQPVQHMNYQQPQPSFMQPQPQTKSKFNFKNQQAQQQQSVPSFMQAQQPASSFMQAQPQQENKVVPMPTNEYKVTRHLDIPNKEQMLRAYCKDVLGFYDAEDPKIPLDYILSDELFGGEGVARYQRRGFDLLDSTLLVTGLAKESQAV